MTEIKRDIMDMGNTPEDFSEYPAENRPRNSEGRPMADGNGGFFLNKFLEDDETSSETEAKSDVASAVGPEADALREKIVEALREIYDPEIPVNIYEMGLIYEVDIKIDNSVVVLMTLTTPHCPVAESMPGEVELKVKSVDGVEEAEVKLVWEPAWDLSRMSDEARLELGML